MAVVWALCVFLAFFVGHVASTSCGTALTGSSGFLTSENFPGNFVKNKVCAWNITVPAGHVIKISFLNFTLEPNQPTDCKNAFGGARLYIHDVASHDNIIPFEICGQQIPAPVYSVYNSIQVRLESSNNVFSGFKASYEAIPENDICPAMAQLNESSGVITSPFYPRKYPTNKDCNWQITANNGSRIRLEIAADMNIHWCNLCVCDYLEIQNGIDTDGAASGKLCKDSGPAEVLTYFSIKESLKLRFFSDGNSAFQNKGFKATYTFLSATPNVCPVEAVSLSGNGVLRSPGYPEDYIASKTCTWKITAPAGKKVKFAFTDFALGSCAQGCTDACTYVDVHDGPAASSPLLARFCHGSTQEEKISSGNQMFVKFHSGFTIDRGFEAEYSVTTEAPSPTVTKPPPTTTTTAKPPTTTGAIVTATLLSVTLPILAVPIFWP